MKKVGVLQFPGSNCDQDVFKALDFCHPEFLVSSQSIEIKDYQAFILPGGFSYGDYLRAGALACFSKAMRDLSLAAKKGWPILGICNGFQILCEAGLLEGALLTNKEGRFIDEWSDLTVENEHNFWKAKGDIKLPIAHGDGSYYVDSDRLKKMQDQQQIWLTYHKNPNGSLNNIAGVMNQAKNVAGLMPHPERAVSEELGGLSGLSFFQSLAS